MEYDENMRASALSFALEYAGKRVQIETISAERTVEIASIFLQFLQGDDDQEEARQAA